MRGEICSVHALSDDKYWILTDKGAIELWLLVSRNLEIVDAKLLDICSFKDLVGVTSICALDDSFGLDHTAVAKSQESLASDSQGSDGLTFPRLRRIFDLRKAYHHWNESEGFQKDDQIHADMLSSRHRYCVGTKAGDILIFEIRLSYDKEFKFKVSMRQPG
jgi:hypothetical protein